MTRSLSFSAVLATLLGVAALGWSANGPSSSADLASIADGACVGALCPVETRGFEARWVGRTGQGQLFVMLRHDCQTGSECVARFVERTATGVATRLDVQGEFQLVPSGREVPDVEARHAVSESEIEITRYAWVGGAYVRGETRQVFQVQGEECGTALECYQKAQAARDQRETGKALRILETVHRVSYI